MSVPIEITFFGVRGTRPVCAATHGRYGGNTACVGVAAGGRRLLFDAGTGIVAAGRALAGQTGAIDIFLSHLHHDHIMGLLHFAPLYEEGRPVAVHAPEPWLEHLSAYWAPPYYPIRLEDVPADLRLAPFDMDRPLHWSSGRWRQSHEEEDAADLSLNMLLLNDVLVYGLDRAGIRVVYATDIELDSPELNQKLAAFSAGADLLICDAQYDQEEYPQKRGWGHNHLEMAINLADEARVKRLALFHHDPDRDDAGMDAFLAAAAAGASCQVDAAREGERITLF